MTEHRDNPTPGEQMARGNDLIAQYNRRLLWLAAGTASVLIALLLVTLVQVASIADGARASAQEAERQTGAIRELVESQTRNDATRQRLIDQAVSDIAAEQRRALVAHDHSVREYMRRALSLLDREVNGAANQERPRAPLPQLILPPQQTRQPLVGPTAQPAPRPAPSPCRQAGNSGRCKR